MSRLFTRRQRFILAMRSGGICEECRTPLPSDFHADHRVPFSRGGPTTLRNGQATCPKCNLRKGNKMTKLRTWQQAARTKAIDYFEAPGTDRRFLIQAAPGAGKTLVACLIAKDLIESGAISRVIVIAPRRSVVQQWAKAFKKATGRRMAKLTNGRLQGIGALDICATWTAVRNLQDVFQATCAAHPVLVICDEHHHAAVEAAWGVSAGSAFQDARFSLILTGTPTRSDGARSIWLEFSEDGALDHPEEASFSFTYGEAVSLGYCRPVTFHRHRGLFTYEFEDGSLAEVSSDGPPRLPENVTPDESLQRVLDFQRFARKPEWEPDLKTPRMDGYHATMIAAASRKLDEIRLDLPEAGGLVIAPDIEGAEFFAAVIERVEGQKPMMVHHRLSEPDDAITEFRESACDRWLVSVGMVSEGVDIPRLRVLVYLPKASTELHFRQAIGRVVRNVGDHDTSYAYVIMPKLEIFDEFARRIEDDMPPNAAPGTITPREKRCAACGEMNLASAFDCVACEAPFPVRSPSFFTCACGSLNPIGRESCQNCGKPRFDEQAIKLVVGERDGVIARGVEIAEAELPSPGEAIVHHRAFIETAERKNRALGEMVRRFTPELLHKFVQVAREFEI